MCGIFAFVNYLTPKTRAEILDVLLQGLRRMEYRGYDSAGLAIDGSDDSAQPHENVRVFRCSGKVANLEDQIKECDTMKRDLVYETHAGIAHTRWATHGTPNNTNAHPQPSNHQNDFVVVHNGILTNYKEIKEFLLQRNYKFDSETDTEVIAKLIQRVAVASRRQTASN